MDDIPLLGAGSRYLALPRTDLLLPGSPSAALLIDEPSTAILEANPAAAALYGFAPAELATMTLADLRDAPGGEADGGDSGGDDGGGGVSVEYHRTADGRGRWVSLAALAAFGEGTPRRLLLLVREADDSAARLARLDAAIDGVLRQGPSWAGLAAAVGPLLAEACDVARAGLAVVGPDGRPIVGEPDDPAFGRTGPSSHPGDFENTPVVRACRTGMPTTAGGEGDGPSALIVPLGPPDGFAAALCLEGVARRSPIDGGLPARVAPVARRLALAARLIRAVQRARLHDTALASTASGVFVTDTDGRIEWINGGLTAMTGYAPNEILGRTPALFRSGRQDAQFYERLWSTILDGLSWAGEVINRRRDGRLITVKQSITPVVGDDGRVSHFVAVHEDITAWREAEARSAYLVAHDQLTGLPNRTLLRDRLNQAMLMADRSNRAVGLIHIDLDRFGDLNAAYGYEAGDRLLVAVAHSLREALRRSDTVARLGADDFAVLLPDLAHPEDVRQVAEKLARQIETLGGAEGIPAQQLGSCAGFAVYPRDAGDADQFVMAAAVALGAAKSGGRGRVAAYSRSMADQLTARIGMQRDLAAALSREEFSLVYQPQVALSDGRVIGIEALLRWRSASRGPVSPAAFVPVAEDSGLIAAIGRWVIEKACRQAADWLAAGLPPLRVAVNISPVQLAAGGLGEFVAEALTRHGLPASALEFELTETVLLTRSPEIVAELAALHDMGVSWAVDDFGTGYASLDYVRHFPVDRLKIDRSFVDGMMTAASDAAIVRSVIGLGQSLGLYVVAEGVETAAQIAALRRLGCDAIQGYVFSRPLPPDQLPAMLAEVLPESAG
jgi:diguanylate cyclase (GGDEF)-like protein/PAS domain S-box-containing protein